MQPRQSTYMDIQLAVGALFLLLFAGGCVLAMEGLRSEVDWQWTLGILMCMPLITHYLLLIATRARRIIVTKEDS